MKLTNLRKVGRYVNPYTNRPVNVHTGRKKGYGVDVLFHFDRRMGRVFIADNEFYSKDKWKKAMIKKKDKNNRVL